MPLELLAGLASGATMICTALVVLARTHGPELTLPALWGWLDLVIGAGLASTALRGTLPWWGLLLGALLALLALWAVAGGRRRPRIVRRATGFGDLGD